ncbi:unnamed protein product [Zymoseptoria tritici ST99CH_1A5]|uniref:Uncharacterized protein n=3 Tax=Zymoseptoria tritici TaxID=1047171 RepID=F9X0I8_ZYMTI|nr:uncharacterized protein MYCGRDRAFT_102849 [Zymoseptoria tritici IPO323]EGP91630.1 hypothetical protein MYCGRDRAFT_102849 [Zymoseptoria tritici IPO323]SMR43004.1 unnamed protein product [Zymoseptoria tritici ST99CH_1E4]SMR45175.1 unnamed protein product [Zymoseptoria tritici ST99CH_3D1]SMY20338.1 unnamed protein product [Zymoseptoria tritici ST99CH_1A5]
MVNSFVASLALFGASASALGAGHVVNKCDYDVYTSVVPASGGGQETKMLTLSPGDSWDQSWTPLTNGAGWSIKFSKEEGSFGSNILQFEYTSQNDGTLWYDLSCVDGTPWQKDWHISSDTDDCIPKQAAYRFSTDDAHGMQNGCPCEASITVTLCSSNSGNSTSGDNKPSGGDNKPSSGDNKPSSGDNKPSSGDNQPAQGTQPSSSSSAAAEPPVYTPPPYVAPALPTTLSTSTLVASQTVDNNYVATVVETVYTYATAAVSQGEDGVLHVNPKRHQHHPHGHAQ